MQIRYPLVKVLPFLLSVYATAKTHTPASSPTRSITVPSSCPETASAEVDRSYPGLAISWQSFNDYAGNKATPNKFSANLIDSIAERIGMPVSIRVGGTAGDRAVYEPSQKEALVIPNAHEKELIPFHMTVGPSWFEGFASLKNVKWTFMAPFADLSNQQNSAEATTQALTHIGPNLEALEIGNEVDMYSFQKARPRGYNTTTYLAEWTCYVEYISNYVKNANLPLQAAVFLQDNEQWNVPKTFTLGKGYLDHAVSASLHSYMYNSHLTSTSLQTNYMNHAAIAAQLEPFRETVDWLAKNRPDVSLHLGEVGSNILPSVLDYASGSNKTLSTFGMALWLADYMLYGMTLGIKRMNVQQSTGFTSSSWRPVGLEGMRPAVLAPWYAHVFVADIMGNTSSIRIVDLSPRDTDMLAVYAVYDATSKALKRVVLINLEVWRTDAEKGGERPAVSVSLDVGNDLQGTFGVDRLTAQGADVMESSAISWKGVSWSWESEGKGVMGKSTSMEVKAEEGRVVVDVLASEAVVVEFGS